MFDDDCNGVYSEEYGVIECVLLEHRGWGGWLSVWLAEAGL